MGSGLVVIIGSDRTSEVYSLGYSECPTSNMESHTTVNFNIVSVIYGIHTCIDSEKDTHNWKRFSFLELRNYSGIRMSSKRRLTLLSKK
jgi:hypothetical protein